MSFLLLIREIPDIKKIKPIMANAQGLNARARLPKIPRIPITRAIAPPTVKTIPKILASPLEESC